MDRSNFVALFARAGMLLVLSVAVRAGPRQTAITAPAAIWQPQLHFYAGPKWNNDPNGPILLNGQYHLFYQYNPFSDQWGHMSWGHAVSRDMVHWTKLPVALLEENGVMIFSGSTVEDRENTSGLCGEVGKKTPGCLVAIYTGMSKISQNQERQNQNLAVSRDGGTTWTKYSGNPVIDLGLKDFRDPKVFWHAPSQSWILIAVLSDVHKAQIYRSKNLKQWELASEFGPAGAVGGVWECPDLMELKVRDANGNRVGSRWVLSINLNPGGVAGGSGNQYFVGEFDGRRFIEDHPGSGPHWADWGKDFYASTSFSNTPPDEDRFWIAWMGNWQYADKVPSLPGRGEMTLVRRVFLRKVDSGAGAEPLVLVQEPVLPRPPHRSASAAQTIDEANTSLAGAIRGSTAYLLRATLKPGTAKEVGVRLRSDTADTGQPATEETIVGIDRIKGQIFVDRTMSGLTSFSPEFPVRTVALLKHPDAKTVSVEIIVDHNSIEVFAEGGETVLTNLIYPAKDSRGLGTYAVSASAGGESAQVRDLELVPLEPITK